jgi:hypothetical protein
MFGVRGATDKNQEEGGIPITNAQAKAGKVLGMQ